MRKFLCFILPMRKIKFFIFRFVFVKINYESIDEKGRVFNSSESMNVMEVHKWMVFMNKGNLKTKITAINIL